MNPIPIINQLRTAILWLCLLLPGMAWAQYPVNVMPMLVPPYSLYLSDYTAPGAEKLTLNVMFNDANESSYDARLQLEIEGNGIKLLTDPNFMPAPIPLMPGMNILRSSDPQLAPYFELDHLLVLAGDEQQIRQSGALPEGMYTFCVQIVDYLRPDVRVSTANCASANILKNNPPILVAPICESTVSDLQEGQTLLFQWQSLLPAGATVEYELDLVEVLPGTSPQDALLGAGTRLLNKQLVSNTTFTYGPEQPALELGKTYAWQIRVLDPLGLTTFENEGLSPPCWFRYGFNEGGNIPLTFPDEGHVFRKEDQFVFENAPIDNAVPGQKVAFEIKIVELNQGQDKEIAIQDNPVFYTERSLEQAATLLWSTLLTNPLPLEKEFAWQLTAYSGEQVVATSEVRSFYSAPFIDHFMAADHRIEVLKITNPDLNALAGRGRANIDSLTTITFDFSGITVRDRAPKFFMMDGLIEASLEETYEVELDNQDNGAAKFRANSLVIRPEAFNLKGKVAWEFPHPVINAQGLPTVFSQEAEVDFKTGQLRQLLAFEQTVMDLLDPAGFQFELSDASIFNITDNVLTLNLSGRIGLPPPLKSQAAERVYLPFQSANNPFLFSQSDFDMGADHLQLFDQAAIALIPQSVIFDFAEDSSAGPQSGNALWKGIIFQEFETSFPADFDKGGQLKLEEAFTLPFTVGSQDAPKAWVGSTGLDLELQHSFAQNGPKAAFNTFEDNFTEIAIDISQGSVSNSFIKGFVFIPILDPEEEFRYTIPFDDNGLQSSFLEDDLQGRTVVFNEDKPDLKVVLNIKQAVFQENNRLELVVDLNWEALEVNLSDVAGLHVWGNGDFGFGSPNGEKALTRQASGRFYESFDISVDKITAGRTGKIYALGLMGNMVLGADVGGESGPPVFNMVSAQENAATSLTAATGSTPSAGNWVSDFVENEFVPALEHSEIFIQPRIKVKSSAFSLDATLTFRKGDPVWGNCFDARAKASFKKPTNFSVDVTFLLGEKDAVNYWFVEVGIAADGADEEQGTKKGKNGEAVPVSKPPASKNTKVKKGKGKKFADGIPLGPHLLLTGLTGRVYHHMSHDVRSGISEDCSLPISFPGSDQVPEKVSINWPSIPDFDLAGLINLPSVDIEALICKLSRHAFKAVLASDDLGDPNFNHLRNEAPNVNWGVVQADFPGVTWSQIELMHPGLDWCKIVARIPGIDWGNLLISLPTLPEFPDICSLSQRLFDKGVAELPAPSLNQLQEAVPSEDWVSVRSQFPQMTWSKAIEISPNQDWCSILLNMPGIDWGGVWIKVDLPQLIIPDIRSLLPDLPEIDWEGLIPTMPNLDFSLELAPVKMDFEEMDIDYVIDPGVSYGGMLMVEIKDRATVGQLFKGTGALEMSFNSDGGLNQIGLQITARVGNKDPDDDESDSYARAVGCMSYTPAESHFLGELYAMVGEGNGTCSQGYMKVDIRGSAFKVNVGDRQNPVIYVLGGCSGLRVKGFFGIDSEKQEIAVGLGIGFGGSVKAPKLDLGICAAQASASAFIDFDADAVVGLDPVELKELGIRLTIYADAKVEFSGVLCDFGELTLLELLIQGEARLKFQPETTLTGTLLAEANLLDLFEVEFDFEVEHTF